MGGLECCGLMVRIEYGIGWVGWNLDFINKKLNKMQSKTFEVMCCMYNHSPHIVGDKT